MDALIRQHTFVMLVMATHALHRAHEDFHRIHIENAIAPTPGGDDLIRAARNRLTFAMIIREQAQVACSACDKRPPHPFFTEGFWR